MSLEGSFQQRERQVVRRYTPQEILAQVEEGNKFIVVENDVVLGEIPQGYTLIDMRYQGDSLRTLVPQSLLFFMANPGEGDTDSALEEIADFYDDAKDFERDMIEGGQTSVQETNWATMARKNYEVYLVNALVRHKRGDRDADGEPVAEFDQEVLDRLDLEDSYVTQRVKAMAALALGKTSDEINAHEVRDLLKHVVVGTRKSRVTENLSKEEFQRITCWAGSHYEIRPKYRKNSDGTKYEIDRLHNPNHMVGQKTYEKEVHLTKPVLDAKIWELEKDIRDHRAKKHGGRVGRHDTALIRQYANLAFIAPENPRAQLDVMPPKRIGEELEDA